MTVNSWNDHHQTQPMADPQWALHATVANHQAVGWRPQWVTPWQVVLVRRPQVNHVLHAILSILTGGLWLFVWLLVAMSTKEYRVMFTVYSDGSLHRDPPLPVAGPPAKQRWWTSTWFIVAVVTLAVVVLFAAAAASGA